MPSALWRRPLAFLGSIAFATICAASPQDAGKVDPVRADELQPEAAAAPTAASMADEQRVRALLADAFVDRAVEVATSPEAYSADLLLALDLAQLAAELDPGNADQWRFLIQVADLADRPDAVVPALEQLVHLDPTDEVARLRRLAAAIESHETAEGRIAAYQAVLTPERVRQIGHTAASRLAFDLAILLQRRGDLQGYARWLVEAVALDPSNPLATSEGAGFFQTTTGDPVAIIELLLARTLADPTNEQAVGQLARLLLQRGAYVGADRLFTIGLERTGGVRYAEPSLLAEAAIARWGQGKSDDALAMLDLRQLEETDQFRQRVQFLGGNLVELGRIDPEAMELTTRKLPLIMILALEDYAKGGDITMDMVRAAVAPAPPELAGLRLALLDRRGRSEAAEAARELTRIQKLNVRTLIERGERLRPETRQAALLAAAWSLLFLGDDLAEARSIVDLADGILPLTDVQRRVVDGWTALRAQRFEEAIAVFEPVVAVAAHAQLGHALAELGLGRRSSGAAGLLKSAREFSGTYVGMWALDRLYAELGVRAPLNADVSEIESLMASVPPTFDRLIRQASRELVINVRPVRSRYGPFDRLEMDVEITNRTDFPLAISPTGPIRSFVVFPLSVTGYGIEQSTMDLPVPAIFDIARRLRIEPRSTTKMRINLGRAPLAAQTLNSATRLSALLGTTLSITGRAMLNAQPAGRSGRADRLEVGNLGSESPPVDFRIEAVPFETTWREAAIERVATIDAVEDIESLVVLAFRSGKAEEARIAALPPEQRVMAQQALDQQVAAITSALPQVGPAATALVALQLTPNRAALADIERSLRENTHPYVRLAALLSLVRGPDDPLLDETRRSDNPMLKRAAEIIGARLARVAAKAG